MNQKIGHAGIGEIFGVNGITVCERVSYKVAKLCDKLFYCIIALIICIQYQWAYIYY